MPNPSITDSPWLWLALFTAVGLAALLATGGKFGKRQSGIERRYQARDWQARDWQARDWQARDWQARNWQAPDRSVQTDRVHALDHEAAAENKASESPRADSGQVATPDYSTPKKTLVGLWPLAGVLGTLCATSLLMLYCTRRWGSHGLDP